MNRSIIPALIFMLTALAVSTSRAQTCSCAGAPLISSQSTGTSAAGNIVAGITYEYHDISAMYSGTTRLSDETVTRTTQSILVEINYGITDRLSVSGTFSYVDKDRTTGLHLPDGGVSVSTRGPGDGIFLLRYVLLSETLWNPWQIALGAGAKAPIGTTSLKNNGFTMNADMQPGTGAWDGVMWMFLSRTVLPNRITAFLTNSYRYSGSNDRFDDSDSYRFGNELVFDAGLSGQMTETLSYMISARYRSTSSDHLNGNALPNTGGSWISLVPAVNLSVSDRISLRLSGRIPLRQDLNGTQPTTSFAVSGTFFISINRNNSTGFNYGKPE